MFTEAWVAIAGPGGERQAILEGFVEFRLECSVIVARGLDGTVQTYAPTENHASTISRKIKQYGIKYPNSKR